MLDFLAAPLLVHEWPSWWCYLQYYYLCWWCYSLLWLWSDIWSVVTARVDSWTWIWSMRHCGLQQKVACWFQFWKSSAFFFLIGLITWVLLVWKLIGLFLRKNHLLRCWGSLSLINWIGALTLSLLLKVPPRKLEPWFVVWSLFLLWLLCISINLP